MKSVTSASDRLSVMVTVATGHSGSTLFSLFLDCHPEITSVGECSVSRKTRMSLKGRPYRCSCGLPLRECSLFSQVFKAVQADGFPLDDGSWVNDYRYENTLAHAVLSNYGRTSIRRSLQRVCDQWLPIHASRRRRTDDANVSFVRAVMAQTGKRIFLDSCKSLCRHAHFLSIPSFDVRILRIVRDVRAYAGSFKRKGQSVEDSAWSWRWYQESADSMLANVPSEQVHVVRYEDFCREPANIIAGIQRFAGVEPKAPPDTLIPREHHVIGNRIRMAEQIRIELNESWRRDLSNEELATIDRIAADMNNRFGYND